MYKRVCFLFTALVMAVGSCSTNEADTSFALEDLLIDRSCFPPGWYVTVANATPYEKKERGAEDAIGIWMEPTSPDLTGAGHEVYRYNSVRAARSAYSKWEKREFNSSSIGSLTSWEAPLELPYRSSIADRYRFACHTNSVSGTPVCKFMGQYEKFLVIFYTGFGGQHMTYADLQRILQAIDARMAHYLKVKTHPE